MPILERFSLSGKTALVTGAGRGIGESLALALAEAGADVAAADIDPSTAEATADTIRSLGRRSLALEADVTASSQVDAMAKSVVDAWGQLDIAVNNAGVARVTASEEVSDEEWDHIVDVDLKGVFICARAEGRVMLPRGSGSIINIASMSAQIVNRPQIHVHYNAAKAGVVQLTRTLAAEWATRGIRVNAISPGHMRTPMTEHQDQATKDLWASNTPMGRNGTPDELQGGVVYLASEAASFVTGHDLVIDGGYTIW